MTRAAAAAIVVSWLSLAPGAEAAQLVVGAGSSLALGSATLDLGCADLVVNGTVSAGTGALTQAGAVTIASGAILEGGSGTLDVTGGWDAAGTFTAGSSRVRFVDGCASASATLAGSASFFDLEMTTSTGKVYSLEAGSTQTVTGSLELSGSVGNRLTLRSTVDGNEAFLDLQGSQSTSNLDVKDNHATGTPISLGPGSVSSGNTSGWLVLAAPALGWLGTIALCIALAVFAVRRLSAPQRA